MILEIKNPLHDQFHYFSSFTTGKALMTIGFEILFCFEVKCISLKKDESVFRADFSIWLL
jgi:hypothetical protein